jgi:hypothetical protein
LPVGDRDHVERLASALAGDEIDALAVGREGEAFNVGVEVRGQFARLLRLSVVEHQTPARALEACGGLRAIGDVATVGRVERRLIRTLVVAGDALRLAARDGHDEDVTVG